MEHDILKYILTTIIGAVLTALIAYIKSIKDKLKASHAENIEEDTAVKQAVKILLRAEIKRQCQYYIDKGSISAQEYEELEESVRVYEALKGNGTVHRLWQAVQKLEIT